MIRRHVSLGKPSLELRTADQLAAELPGEVVEVKLDLSDGLKGEHSCLLPVDTATSIAGSMMGQPEIELDDAALSAVAEAMSQITAISAAELGNQIGRSDQDQPADLPEGVRGGRAPAHGRADRAGGLPPHAGRGSPRAAHGAVLRVGGQGGRLPDGRRPGPPRRGRPQPQPGFPAGGGAAQAFGAAGGGFGMGGQPATGAAAPFPGVQQTFGQAMGAAPNVFQQAPPNVQPVQFANLQPTPAPQELGNIGLLMDVYMELTVELGRTKKLIRTSWASARARSSSWTSWPASRWTSWSTTS